MHLEPFPISVVISFIEKYTYFVEEVPVSIQEEHFWVMRAEETLVLSSNRPLFRGNYKVFRTRGSAGTENYTVKTRLTAVPIVFFFAAQ